MELVGHPEKVKNKDKLGDLIITTAKTLFTISIIGIRFVLISFYSSLFNQSMLT